MIRLSYVIPVYNVEAWLPRCLDSVLAQDVPEAEIVCVNDGSTDGSRQILEAYAARESRIRILDQANAGLAAARNAGLEVCRGDAVLFVDSDDALPRGSARTMVAALERTGADLVVAERLAATASSEKFGQYVSSTVTAEVVTVRSGLKTLKRVIGGSRMRSSAWNKCYRRSVLEGVRFHPGILFEDWPFLMLVLFKASRTAFVDAFCYVYWKGGSSIVRSPFDERKARSYEAGIRDVMAACPTGSSWRRQALRRCAIAAAMMINKTFKADAALRPVVRAICANLRQDGCLRYRDMPLKSLLRLMVFPKNK